MSKTFEELQVASGRVAREGGWDEGRPEDGSPYLRTYIGNQIGMIAFEAGEAHEELRDGHAPDHTYYRADGKPEGVPPELADVVIRCMHLADREGINLEAAIIEKLAYNTTRGHRHGGKEF